MLTEYQKYTIRKIINNVNKKIPNIDKRYCVVCSKTIPFRDRYKSIKYCSSLCLQLAGHIKTANAICKKIGLDMTEIVNKFLQ